MQHKALSFRGEQSPSHFENCTPTKVNTHSHKLNVFLLGEHPHAFNSRSIFDKRYLLWTIFYIYLSSGENCAQSSLWRSQSPASATCHQLRLTRRPRLFTSKGIIGGSFFCTLLLITQPTLLKCRHIIKTVLVDIIICIHEVSLTRVKSLF